MAVEDGERGDDVRGDGAEWSERVREGGCDDVRDRAVRDAAGEVAGDSGSDQRVLVALAEPVEGSVEDSMTRSFELCANVASCVFIVYLRRGFFNFERKFELLRGRGVLRRGGRRGLHGKLRDARILISRALQANHRSTTLRRGVAF